jgi:hypothetical protein
MEVVSVSTSAKLSALISGNALQKETVRITVQGHAAGIYMNDGTASAASVPLGTYAWTFMRDKNDEILDVEFYAAEATDMSVIQSG